MGANILEALSVELASQTFRDVSLKEAIEEFQSVLAALVLYVLGKPQRVLGDAVGEVPIRASTEGSSAKDELVYANPERPPIDCIGVTLLGEDFWSHIGH